MSCSWDEHWKSSNERISWERWDCAANVPIEVKLAPGEAYEKTLSMLLLAGKPQEKVSFKMGFTPIGSKQTFWSNEVTLQVDGVEKPEAKEKQAAKPKEAENDTSRTDEPAVKQGKFFDREGVALLEVVNAGPAKPAVVPTIPATGAGNLPAFEYRVTVEVKSSLPPDKTPEAGTKVVCVVTHLDLEKFKNPFGAAKIPYGFTEDWFPLKPGEQFVAAFDGKKLPVNAREMRPVGSKESWHDFTTFYNGINSPKENRGQVLAKSLKEDQQHLSPVFFDLIDRYDHRIIEERLFSLATAEYLANGAIPPRTRREIFKYIDERKGRDPEANAALVLAMIKLARYEKCQLGTDGSGTRVDVLEPSFCSGKAGCRIATGR